MSGRSGLNKTWVGILFVTALLAQVIGSAVQATTHPANIPALAGLVGVGAELDPLGRIVIGTRTGVVQYRWGSGEHLTLPGPSIAVSRYTADGQADPTYGDGGIAILRDVAGRTQAVAVDEESRSYVLADAFIQPQERYGFLLARFDEEGILDPTFGDEGLVQLPLGMGAYATVLVIQPDGKLLAAGSYYDETFQRHPIIARFRQDGQLDLGFANAGISTPGTGAQAEIVDLAVDPQLQHLTALMSPCRDCGYSTPILFRSDEAGRPLSSYGLNGYASLYNDDYFTPSSMTLLDTGAVYVVGSICPSDNCGFAVIRTRPDGAVDESFGEGGSAAMIPARGHAWGASIILDPEGRPLVAGWRGTSGSYDKMRTDLLVARYRQDGSPAAGFGSGGTAVTPLGNYNEGATDLLVGSGHLIAVGYTCGITGCRIALVGYDPSGQTDPSFGSGGSTPVTMDERALYCSGRKATIVGTPRTDMITGTNGNDVIVSLGGRDRILGRGGNDLICGNLGGDQIWGGPGRDRIDGGHQIDDLSGGSGDDVIHTGGGYYWRYGLDVARGGRGQDLLIGDWGPNELYGGNGSDVLAGIAAFFDECDCDSAFAEVLAGGPGNDILVGGSIAGRNILTQRLLGGDGDDSLDANGGGGELDGGAGTDSCMGGDETFDC